MNEDAKLNIENLFKNELDELNVVKTIIFKLSNFVKQTEELLKKHGIIVIDFEKTSYGYSNNDHIEAEITLTIDDENEKLKTDEGIDEISDELDTIRGERKDITFSIYQDYDKIRIEIYKEL